MLPSETNPVGHAHRLVPMFHLNPGRQAQVPAVAIAPVDPGMAEQGVQGLFSTAIPVLQLVHCATVGVQTQLLFCHLKPALQRHWVAKPLLAEATLVAALMPVPRAEQSWQV